MSVHKLLIIGDGGVGKTSLVKILSHPEYKITPTENFKRTVMFNFEQVKIDGENTICFDVAGQTNEGIYAIKEMSRFIMGKVGIILMMFAVDRLNSLLNLNNWYEAVLQTNNQLNQQLPPIILIANKIDKDIQFDDTMAINLVESNNHFVDYSKISCKTRDGINELRKDIANVLDNYQTVGDLNT